MAANRFWQRGKLAKAIALVCIYGLNLVFFQSLLADPYNDATESFNIFASDNNDHSQPDNDNAVDYYQLFKHANNSERPLLILPPCGLIGHIVAELPVPVKQELGFDRWLFYAHLPTEAFKIYKRIRVFLI
jgi:hypothetical protein